MVHRLHGGVRDRDGDAALGRGDKKAVQKAVGTSVVAAPLPAALQVPAKVLPGAVLYLRIYLVGLPVILLYNFESAIFRAAGQTRLPLFALALSGALNVVLNLVLVIGFHMSVNGVALATVISNAVSSLLLLDMLFRTKLPIRIARGLLRINGQVLSKILQIGLPAGIQGAVFGIANILIQSAINSLGTAAIAAFSAAFNIEIFCCGMLNSFSQACAAFTGQNRGAGNLARCRKVLRVCLIEDAIASVSSVALMLFFGRQLLSLFNTNSEVIRLGCIRLTTVLAAYAFSMCYEVMSGYLRGFGISVLPAILTTLGVCGTGFIWIFAVFPLRRSFQTIMLVYPLSLGITAGLILLALLHAHPSTASGNGRKTRKSAYFPFLPESGTLALSKGKAGTQNEQY